MSSSYDWSSKFLGGHSLWEQRIEDEDERYRQLMDYEDEMKEAYREMFPPNSTSWA